MNKELLDAQNAARMKALKQVTETRRKVSGIYAQAANEMTDKITKAKDWSLTQRWAIDMRASLGQSAKKFARDSILEIERAAKHAASLPAEANAGWLTDVYTKSTGSHAGELIGETFRNMFTKTADEALEAVLSGRAYMDGKSMSSRIWSAEGRFEDGINAVMQQGIAQKKSAVAIARDLEKYVNPNARETVGERDPRLPFPNNVEYNCLRVARTTINHAYHIAMKNAAVQNPFTDSIHWALSSAHDARQVIPFGADVCDEYATHNEGLGVGNWPVNWVPLPHAQCMCLQYAVVEKSLEEIAKELHDWAYGSENAKMDAYFAEWKEALTTGLPNRYGLSGIRDDAVQIRKGLIEKIAGRADVQKLSVTERSELITRLENTSVEGLQNIGSGDALESEQMRNALNNLMGYDILNLENIERELRAGYPLTEVDRGLRIADIETQGWYNELKPKDRKAIAQAFENATDAELEFWQRHGELVKGNFYAKGEQAYYAPKSKRVTLDVGKVDARAKRAGWNSNLRAFFHETGHAFDSLAYGGTSVTAEMPELRQKLSRDFVGYANGILAKYGQAPISDASNISATQADWLKRHMQNQDPHLTSSVSDLIEGITGRRVQGRYGHEDGYWKGKAVEREAIAHMFECSMTKGERLQAFEKAFPESMGYFRDTLTRLEGVK